jgi:hypothetical protein
MKLAAGWSASEMPYLAVAPARLTRLDTTVPALDPGASVELSVPLPPAGSGRQIVWITLLDTSGDALTERGVSPLQLANQQP